MRTFKNQMQAFAIKQLLKYEMCIRDSGEVAPFRQVGEQGKGFILVPFAESEEVPAWFIRGDITFREVTTDIEIRTGLSGTMGLTDIKPGQEPDISWEEYESQVAAMVAALKQGQVRKMVLSRTITLQERAYEKAAVWYTACLLYTSCSF